MCGNIANHLENLNMKLLVFLISLSAIYAINAIPFQEYYSQYKDETSRYVWMSDDEGSTQLVDLQEPVDTHLLEARNGANNQYWLFTRSNPNHPQLISYGSTTSLTYSNYAANKPLKVVVHGWNGSRNSILNTRITSAFLALFDVNVIVVDWRELADSRYVTAAAGVPSVGQNIGNFVVWLINTSRGNWNNVHFVGFSLGAHAVGIAGRVAGGRPMRVTGLDPAGPLWHTNSNAINVEAGQYVEIIHTEVQYMGIIAAVGHADFYPNRGRNQPGCDHNQCSHSRAHELFASSIRTNHFVGRKCSSLSEALASTCSGSPLDMGNGILTKRGEGIYALTTRSSWPF